MDVNLITVPETNKVENKIRYNSDKFQVADIKCVIECEMKKIDHATQGTNDIQRLKVTLIF